MFLINVLPFILICIVIKYCILSYRRRMRFNKAANALPGPKTQPFFGNAQYFLQKDFDEYLNLSLVLAKNYPSPCRFWLANKLIIYIYEPDQIKTILRHRACLNKNDLYKPFHPWLGKGLLTAPASKWILHRKMIAPSFNTNIIRTFSDTFMEHSLIFMDKLEKIISNSNEEIELLHYIMMCNMDIVYGTTLGIKDKSQSHVIDEYINGVTRVKEMIGKRLRNVFLLSDVIFNLTSMSREQQKILRSIYSIADKVIQKKEHAENNNMITTEDGKYKKVFLDVLMEASLDGNKFTRQDIHDHINTILFAGSDTTAITLNFVVFILANFPEIQEKVYKELCGIYGTKDPKSTPVKYDDLRCMEYMERVIKETLRFFPVAPIMGRRLTEDLKIGEYLLPKDSNIIIIVADIHRNEKYWPNALTFDPDRFLPENITKRHPYCYIPFSNGPRNCIGARYAMTFMKIFLAILVRTYIFEVDKSIELSEIKIKMDSLINTFEPLKVKIRKRNSQPDNVKI